MDEEFEDYELGGVTIQLPAGASEEQVQSAISGFMQTMEFDDIVDKDTGAPAYVRGIVGSVYKPEDKLATLKRHYPDAVPYKDGNFVFTNPNTGRPTLYNPKGIDIGDVASVAREVTQTVTSGIGAAAGATGGGIISIPTGGTAAPISVPAGAIVGAGVGSAIGGAAFDKLLGAFTEDTRTGLEKQADFAVDFAGGAIGEGVGRAIGPFFKRVFGGGTKEAQKIVTQMKKYGIKPSASVVTRDSGLGRLEAGLAQSPASASIIEKQTEEILSQTHAAVSKVISDIGQPKTPQGAGEVIKQAAESAAKRFGAKQNRIYEKAFDMIGEDTPVRVDAIKELRLSLMENLAGAPKSLKGSLGRAISEIDNIIADASEKGIPFKTLRQIRTNIGRDLDAPLLSGSTGAQNEAMKMVYGALTDDISRAAAGASDEAAKTLKQADILTKEWAQGPREVLNKIAKFDADEKAYRFALSSSRDGGTSLSRLRRNFKPEEWDTIAASVLDKLGDASAGAQNATGDVFSINAFVTNWNKLAPEAKDALLGGTRYKAERQALEELTELMSLMKDVKRFSNTSNTSGAIYALAGLNALGVSAGAMLTGDVEGGAKGLGVTTIGTILAPRMAAKLITNPKFVSWLAEPAKQGVSSAATHIAKLVAIGEAEPEIKEEIHQFIKQMELNTRPE